MSDITTERVGRRTYIRGNTFSIKDLIRDAGGHWDADAKAWWLGDDTKAQAIVSRVQAAPPPVEATGRFTKLADDTWGVRGQNLTAGSAVTIFKSDGTRVTRTVKAVLATATDGWQTASLEPEVHRAAGRGFRSAGNSRGTRTGCSCGSVVEFVKSSDCWSCKHDSM